MPKVTFDTNILIGRKIAKFPNSYYPSVVVVAELVAGASDEATVKSLEAFYRNYEKADRLLVPTAEDWWLTGKIINSLQRRLKTQHGGQTPRLPAEERYRLTNDVLIARTARRAGVIIVTDNLKDFETIAPFCRANVQSGDAYLATL